MFQLTGQCHSYVASETPMVMYANVHAALDDRRARAAANSAEQGPRVRSPHILIGCVAHTISLGYLGGTNRLRQKHAFEDLNRLCR